MTKKFTYSIHFVICYAKQLIHFVIAGKPTLVPFDMLFIHDSLTCTVVEAFCYRNKCIQTVKIAREPLDTYGVRLGTKDAYHFL